MNNTMFFEKRHYSEDARFSVPIQDLLKKFATY